MQKINQLIMLCFEDRSGAIKQGGFIKTGRLNYIALVHKNWEALQRFQPTINEQESSRLSPKCTFAYLKHVRTLSWRLVKTIWFVYVYHISVVLKTAINIENIPSGPLLRL